MAVSIVDAMTDENLFGNSFGADSFAAWRALLGAFYGLPLDDEAQGIVQALTDRESGPHKGLRELWVAVGRRGGKSHAAALLAAYEACFRDHRDKLAPGEIATVMVIASDRRQARTVMRYIAGLIKDNPMLSRMVHRENSELIEFNNRSAIEVHTASHRAVRGYTLAAVILDEIAFWHSDGANPDVEVVAALRPALATLDGRLIGISSPYARRGVLWDTYKRHFAQDSDRVLVAQAPSRSMNPTLPQGVIDDAMREDSARASAEYLAQFRDDIETFLNLAVIEAATRPDPLIVPPARGVRYFAFVDPSGGGADEFTLCIGHMDERRIIVDLVTGRKGSPAAIVAEYADLLEEYGVSRVMGDRYAGRWPRDEFRKWGVSYDTAELTRSDLYLEMLAALNSGRVELPPDELMVRQLTMLERQTSRAGRDSIDHPPGGHDDRANAVAGLVANAEQSNKGRVGKLRVFI